MVVVFLVHLILFLWLVCAHNFCALEIVLWRANFHAKNKMRKNNEIRLSISIRRECLETRTHAEVGQLMRAERWRDIVDRLAWQRLAKQFLFKMKGHLVHLLN